MKIDRRVVGLTFVIVGTAAWLIGDGWNALIRWSPWFFPLQVVLVVLPLFGAICLIRWYIRPGGSATPRERRWINAGGIAVLLLMTLNACTMGAAIPAIFQTFGLLRPFA